MSKEIIYFTSQNCSICKTQQQVLKEFEKLPGISIQNILITTAFDLALLYGVKSAPTIILLKDKKALRVLPGFQTADKIIKYINELF